MKTDAAKQTAEITISLPQLGVYSVNKTFISLLLFIYTICEFLGHVQKKSTISLLFFR